MESLSRRERQIMSAVYGLGRATVAEVEEQITDSPSRNAVRTTMGILVNKGLLRQEWDGTSKVYWPTADRTEAGGAAMDHLAKTFFDGSIAKAVGAFFSHSAEKLSQDEIDALMALVEAAKRRGR